MSDSDEEDRKQTRRLQFEFSLDAYQRLERMKTDYDASSFAELVRNALRLYDWVKTKEGEGYDLGLIGKDGQVKSVKLLL